MKRTVSTSLLFFVMIALTFLVGCSDDKNNVTSAESTISNSELIGSWKLAKICYNSNGTDCEIDPVEANVDMIIEIGGDEKAQIISHKNGNQSTSIVEWVLFENALMTLTESGDQSFYEFDAEHNQLKMCCSYTTPEGQITQATYVFVKG